MKALAIAATGMNAQQTNLEVIANNIANINTTGYKRARAEFSDLLYQVDRTQGVPNRANAIARAGRRHDRPRRQDDGGAQRAHPGRADQHRQQLRPGADRQGLVPDRGRRRRDALHPRRRLQHQRHRPAGDASTASSVMPAITVPADAVEVIVNKTGQVFARIDGQTDLQNLGQLHARQLRQRGRPRAARRQSLPGNRRPPARPMSACPAIPASPRSSRAISRASNVDPVKEITELISAQRAYEMNSKVIQAADEMAAVVSKNIR